MVFYISENFYSKWNVSLACAAAMILFLIVLALTMLQMAVQKRWDTR